MMMIRSHVRDGAEDDDDDDNDDGEDDNDDDDSGISNQEGSDVGDEEKGDRKQEKIFQQYQVDDRGGSHTDATSTVDYTVIKDEEYVDDNYDDDDYEED